MRVATLNGGARGTETLARCSGESAAAAPPGRRKCIASEAAAVLCRGEIGEEMKVLFPCRFVQRRSDLNRPPRMGKRIVNGEIGRAHV